MEINPIELAFNLRRSLIGELENGEVGPNWHSDYQLFVISEEVYEAVESTVFLECSASRGSDASMYIEDQPDAWPVIPKTARCPATSTILVISNPDNAIEYCMLRLHERFCLTTGVLSIDIRELTPTGSVFLGAIIPGKKLHLENLTDGEMSIRVLEVAFALSLINQPRFVKQTPAISRQQRRALGRKSGMGFAVNAWTRVSWNIGKGVIAKLSRDPNFHRMPLHFRRGHWRSSCEDVKNSKWLTVGEAGPRGPGWYTWVKECWPGHPAFGIKKSYHVPKLAVEAMLNAI